MSGIKNKIIVRNFDRLYSHLLKMTSDVSIYTKDKKTKILMFHDISDNTKDPFSISEDKLEKLIIACIEQEYRFISLDEYLCDQKGNCKNRIIMTFDDGFKSVYTIALPMLEEYNIPFVTYISTALIDKEKYLSSDDMRCLSQIKNCTIGSHLHHHLMSRYLTDDELKYEVLNSIEILERITSKKIEHLALPYGSITACSYRDIKLLRGMGLSSIALTRQKPVSVRDKAYKLPRIDGSRIDILK